MKIKKLNIVGCVSVGCVSVPCGAVAPPVVLEAGVGGGQGLGVGGGGRVVARGVGEWDGGVGGVVGVGGGAQGVAQGAAPAPTHLALGAMFLESFFVMSKKLKARSRQIYFKVPSGSTFTTSISNVCFEQHYYIWRGAMRSLWQKA